MADLTAAERRKRFEANREMCKEFVLNEMEIARLEGRNKLIEPTVKDFLSQQESRQVECGPDLWLKLIERVGSLGKKAIEWLKDNGHKDLVKTKEVIDVKALKLSVEAGAIKESAINRFRGKPVLVLQPVYPGLGGDNTEPDEE